MLSLLLHFGPYPFYVFELFLWALATLGILAGVDANKFLGMLAIVVWPLYGLFIISSVIAHTIFLIRRHDRFLLPLFLINLFGIIGYWIFVLIVLKYACYGGGSCF